MDQRLAIQSTRALGQSYSLGMHHSWILDRSGIMLLRVRTCSETSGEKHDELRFLLNTNKPSTVFSWMTILRIWTIGIMRYKLEVLGKHLAFVSLIFRALIIRQNWILRLDHRRPTQLLRRQRWSTYCSDFNS